MTTISSNRSGRVPTTTPQEISRTDSTEAVPETQNEKLLETHGKLSSAMTPGRELGRLQRMTMATFDLLEDIGEIAEDRHDQLGDKIEADGANIKTVCEMVKAAATYWAARDASMHGMLNTAGMNPAILMLDEMEEPAVYRPKALMQLLLDSDIPMSANARKLAQAVVDKPASSPKLHFLEVQKRSAHGASMVLEALKQAASPDSSGGEKISDLEGQIIVGMAMQLSKPFRDQLREHILEGNLTAEAHGPGAKHLKGFAEGTEGPGLKTLQKKLDTLRRIYTERKTRTKEEVFTEEMGFLLMASLGVTWQQAIAEGSDGGQKITPDELTKILHVAAQADHFTMDEGASPQSIEVLEGVLESAPYLTPETTAIAKQKLEEFQALEVTPKLDRASFKEAQLLSVVSEALGTLLDDQFIDAREASMLVAMAKYLPQAQQESIGTILKGQEPVFNFEPERMDAAAFQILKSWMENPDPSTGLPGDLQKRVDKLDQILNGEVTLSDSELKSEAFGFVLMSVMGSLAQNIQSESSTAGRAVDAGELKEMLEVTALVDKLGPMFDPDASEDAHETTTEMLSDLVGGEEITPEAKAVAEETLAAIRDGSYTPTENTALMHALAHISGTFASFIAPESGAGDRWSEGEARTYIAMTDKLPKKFQDGMKMMFLMGSDGGVFRFDEERFERAAFDTLNSWMRAPAVTPTGPEVIPGTPAEELAKGFYDSVYKGEIDAAMAQVDLDKPFWNDNALASGAAVKEELEGDSDDNLASMIQIENSTTIDKARAVAVFGDQVGEALTALEGAGVTDVELVNVKIGFRGPYASMAPDGMPMLAMVATNAAGDLRIVGVTDS